MGRRLVTGGMVYIGGGTRSADGHGTEPCLIDPRLPVHWKHPDWTGNTMGYWPSYHRVEPRARAAYLTWLAEGRQSETAYIGYVFLFFYGLERRLLVDLGSDVDHPEVAVIVAEVERLLGIYGANRSFSGYAHALLDYIAGLRSVNTDIPVVQWDPDHKAWEVPAPVRVGIGRYVANGSRIPPEWALSYLRHHPERQLRTPAKRCHAEFDELFKIRYRSRFGAGIKVRRPARNLKLSYRAASGGFSGEVSVTLDTIPDITTVWGPINKLKDLCAECTDELDAYSRFIGRRPDEAETAAAISLLPDVLFASHGGPIIDGLRAWTSQVLAERSRAVVPFDNLVERWSPGRTAKLTKRDAVSLASLLGKIGVGIAPDVRFGASTPKPGSEAVLFPLPVGAAAAPSPQYAAAMSLVHLTAVVAAADGTISSAEREYLSEHIERVLGLDTAERTRLESHLVFLATGRLGMAGMKRKVEALPTRDRATIGEFLIDIAAADGVVSPEEITTLTKVFGYLGLEEADVYRQVHALGTGDRGPITVRHTEPTTRWEIPETVTGQRQPSTVVLDPAKVEARLAETAHVTALLTDIFADDDAAAAGAAGSQPDPPGRPATGPTPPAMIDGLDAAHSAFANALTARSEWDRGAIEQMAESLELPFVDSALDIVNEAAIDACGEPLVEGDDPVELNPYAIEELL